MRILLPPQRRHRLRLRVEHQPRLPIERQHASPRDTLLVPRKRERRQWYRNGHVQSHLAGLDVLLEVVGGGTAPGEDGGAVAVLVGVDEVDGGVECVHGEADEDGAKDFFGVAAHVGFDVRDYGGTDLERKGEVSYAEV